MTDAERAVTELIDFLNAQIGEDERKARAASAGPWRYDEHKHHRLPGTCLFSEAVFAGPAGRNALCVATTGETDDPQSMADAAFIAGHDPARALREVRAKRRIIRTTEGGKRWRILRTNRQMAAYREWAEHVLCLLALPYDDHPDYQERWRVS